MCFYSAPWPSYYIAHSLQLPVVSKLIRNLNVMASQFKKKKKDTEQKKRALLMPLSLGISSLFWPRRKLKHCLHFCTFGPHSLMLTAAQH